MRLDSSYIQTGLKKKGFIEEKGKKRDRYFRFYINGEIKTKIRSKVGGHSKRKYRTLPDGIINRIIHSLSFNDKEQLIDFLECPFELEDYQRMLIEKERIDPHILLE